MEPRLLLLRLAALVAALDSFSEAKALSGTCPLGAEPHSSKKGAQMMQVTTVMPEKAGHPALVQYDSRLSRLPPREEERLPAPNAQEADREAPHAAHHWASLLSTDAESVEEPAEKGPEGCDYKVGFTMTVKPQDGGYPHPLHVKDLAIGMISGREDFFNTTHNNVLQYAPRGLLIRATGKCPCSFRAALKVLRDKHPHAKWYYVGDEDAIINLTALVDVLKQFDPYKPTLVSSNGGHSICSSCGACPEMKNHDGGLNTKAFYGGTGQILSHGLVKDLLPTLANSCREAFRPTLEGFGDLENTCHMANLWKPHWRVVRLQRYYATWSKFRSLQPPFIVAHHLCVQYLNQLNGLNGKFTQHHKDMVLVDNSLNDGCVREEAQLQSTGAVDANAAAKDTNAAPVAASAAPVNWGKPVEEAAAKTAAATAAPAVK